MTTNKKSVLWFSAKTMWKKKMLVNFGTPFVKKFFSLESGCVYFMNDNYFKQIRSISVERSSRLVRVTDLGVASPDHSKRWNAERSVLFTIGNGLENVSEATAEILGGPDLHLRAGSQLRLVCTLRQSTEPPSYVFWFHEQKMINYDPGVSVFADSSCSVLLVQETDKAHNGNYTCSPSNAVPASINVHVLNSTSGKRYVYYFDRNAESARYNWSFKHTNDNLPHPWLFYLSV